jgi:hypothetical protein
MALLGSVAVAALPAGHPALSAVQGELRASLEQAFLLARARGRSVRVALGGPVPGRPEPATDVPPLALPRGVRWGLPQPAIPLPPGMAPPIAAHLTGSGHASVTVGPGRTAEANAWFLTDGRDAVCLRLSDHGQIRLLRWRHRLRQWRRA